MGRRQVPSRKPAAAPREKLPLAGRWWGKCVLLLLTIALLTFSFAPFKQFYLAWIGLVPWLILLRWCRSPVTAFLWSWIGGVGFFIANMWWLAWVTGPGMIALMVVLGLYWGVAGAIIRGARLLVGQAFLPASGRCTHRPESESEADRNVCPTRFPVASVVLIAVIWVALEWLRATWPLGGLPWLYLGHAQSPVLHLCQIADLTGVFGISFWVALINASAALVVIHRLNWRKVAPAGGLVVLVLAGVLGYGVYRFHDQTTTPGPIVLVVQPNYPQDNTGEKSADPADIVAFHVNATRLALSQHPNVDLVVWSETMMPALNPEARQFTQNLPTRFWQRESALMRFADEQITFLAREFHTCLLVGGVYHDQWTVNSKGMAVPQDRRNAAFLYTPQGRVNPRYDKIHLVPFGEFLPFKSAIPPLYRLFLSMSPYPEEYTLTAGPPDAMTVFTLDRGWRFVTPICFEDIDAALVHRMFEPDGHGKRADFIVNITNDGWFKYNEMPQHLQAAVFRSIENRVPTARGVNTGISGFIDSNGRTSGLIPAGTEGVSVATLPLDSRLTFYTRFGDVFAIACAVLTALLTLTTVLRSLAHRARPAPEKPDENTDRPNR